jgi:DNA-directed RNA polymerase specialized sigma24 family protein
VISTNGAVRAIEETVAASEALREHLKRTERIGRKMISALQRGAALSEAVDVAGESSGELRRTAAEYLSHYEASRHRMRNVFMLGSLDEGLSIGEMARKLGISRQLASRLIHEARESQSLMPG